MGTKNVPYNNKGVNQLPQDKPVIYKINTAGGNLNYVGVAQRGRAQDRIKEHIGQIPGASVSVKQFSSIVEARKEESKVIKPRRTKI